MNEEKDQGLPLMKWVEDKAVLEVMILGEKEKEKEKEEEKERKRDGGRERERRRKDGILITEF